MLHNTINIDLPYQELGIEQQGNATITAKNKTVYSRMTSREYVFSIICAFLPLLWLPQPVYLLAGIFPVITWYFLTSFMKRKIQGYTGDCCGATFLLCELSFYMGFVIIYQTI